MFSNDSTMSVIKNMLFGGQGFDPSIQGFIQAYVTRRRSENLVWMKACLDLTGGLIATPDLHVYSYPPNISGSATVKELDE